MDVIFFRFGFYWSLLGESKVKDEQTSVNGPGCLSNLNYSCPKKNVFITIDSSGWSRVVSSGPTSTRKRCWLSRDQLCHSVSYNWCTRNLFYPSHVSINLSFSFLLFPSGGWLRVSESGEVTGLLLFCPFYFLSGGPWRSGRTVWLLLLRVAGVVSRRRHACGTGGTGASELRTVYVCSQPGKIAGTATTFGSPMHVNQLFRTCSQLSTFVFSYFVVLSFHLGLMIFPRSSSSSNKKLN